MDDIGVKIKRERERIGLSKQNLLGVLDIVLGLQSIKLKRGNETFHVTK